MKKFMSFLLLYGLSWSLHADPSILGRWTTWDESTNQARALVDLELSGDTLRGRILHVFKQDGDKGICSTCPGDFKNKPIEGIYFMWGLKNQGHGVWDNGYILDPKIGKIYRAKLKLIKNKLYVRGYVGVSVLGRTQVWKR